MTKFLVAPTYGVACKHHLFDTLEEAKAYNAKAKHKYPWSIAEVQPKDGHLEIIRWVNE